MIKRKLLNYVGLLLVAFLTVSGYAAQPKGFVHVSGQNLIQADGTKLDIKGTNLGNWLNPEGYMFDFHRTNSAHMINEMFCELVGPDATAEFWKAFKDNYITREDIRFIASTGSNTIRLPFNYRLFTDEDYMGLTSDQDGFKRMDDVVKWCKEFHLYVILDMHDVPGGQTGDNIDDSYGYPWVFESVASQNLFCRIWKEIAGHFKNEPTVLGYELMNEPVAPYFSNKDEMNTKLEILYKRAVSVIRTVDKNHIVLLGGPQWNSNFGCFTDWKFDKNIMYTCHRYGGEPTAEAIKEYIDFRNKTNLPMYMGEIGHNTYEWMGKFVKVLNENNIGWTFWPYKKIKDSSFVGFKAPENWDAVVRFCEGPRATYKEIRDNRPEQSLARKAMDGFIENVKFTNCTVEKEYIQSIGLK